MSSFSYHLELKEGCWLDKAYRCRPLDSAHRNGRPIAYMVWLNFVCGPYVTMREPILRTTLLRRDDLKAARRALHELFVQFLEEVAIAVDMKELCTKEDRRFLSHFDDKIRLLYNYKKDPDVVAQLVNQFQASVLSDMHVDSGIRELRGS